MRYFVGVWACLILFLHCVGKGKYVALQSQSEQLTADVAQIQGLLEREMLKNESLQEKYSDKQDEMMRVNALNNQLLNDKIQLEQEVNELNDRINSISSQAEVAQRKLNQELTQRNEQLALKEARLQQMVDWYQHHTERLDRVKALLQEVVQSYNSEQIELIAEPGELHVLIFADFLFNTRQQIVGSGLGALNEIGSVFLQYPEIVVAVEGHANVSDPTGNQDLLAMSGMRSQNVVSHFIQEVGLNANQCRSLAFGNFDPRVSNSTQSGRKYNDRIELVLLPNYGEIFRMLSEAEN